MELITLEDVYNELGVQLAEELGEQPQFAKQWLRRRQDEIMRYIGKHSFYGAAQAEEYLRDPVKRKVIRNALIDYVVIIRRNNYVVPCEMLNKKTAEDYYTLPDDVTEALDNAGLLYVGKC